jgi:hypothetical protein
MRHTNLWLIPRHISRPPLLRIIANVTILDINFSILNYVKFRLTRTVGRQFAAFQILTLRLRAYAHFQTAIGVVVTKTNLNWFSVDLLPNPSLNNENILHIYRENKFYLPVPLLKVV